MMKILKYILFIVFSLTNHSAICQQWRDVGGGADNTVYCFYKDTINDLLYVGGLFDHLGNQIIHQVGIWDGNNWSALGSNDQFMKNSSSGTVMTITRFNGEVVAAGLFDTVSGVPVNNIARWDGAHWNAMGNGFDDKVYSLQVYNGELYAGGEFQHSGGDTLYHISKWDGSNWIRLGIGYGVNNAVTSMTIYDNKLIISGLFTSVFMSSIGGRIVGWDGANWITMNGAFNDAVFIVRNINDTLYAGGKFTAFASNQSNYISRYDGNSWQPMPYPNGSAQRLLYDITRYGDDLYVCGYFTSAPDVVKFNGVGYDSIGSAIGFVSEMIEYRDELYVLGMFTSINNLSLFNIARYGITNNIYYNNINNHITTVYPNPVIGQREIRVRLGNTNKIIEIDLLSIYGEKIKKYIFSNSWPVVKLPDNIAPGMYIIEILDNKNNKYSNKIVIY